MGMLLRRRLLSISSSWLVYWLPLVFSKIKCLVLGPTLRNFGSSHSFIAALFKNWGKSLSVITPLTIEHRFCLVYPKSYVLLWVQSKKDANRSRKLFFVDIIYTKKIFLRKIRWKKGFFVLTFCFNSDKVVVAIT